MGLDMYLSKRKHILLWKNQQVVKNYKVTIEYKLEDNSIINEVINEVINMYNPKLGIIIETPFAYWRKANAIHRFFVDINKHKDDCENIKVSYIDLVELRERCKRILEKPELAEQILPTQEGFFFGPTEYEDWYMEDIKNTIEILKDLDPECEYIYCASW